VIKDSEVKINEKLTLLVTQIFYEKIIDDN